MKTNMGFMDRVIRLMLASMFAGLFFAGYISGGLTATILWIIGTIFFITSLIGFCPLYTLLGLKTIKKKQG